MKKKIQFISLISIAAFQNLYTMNQNLYAMHQDSASCAIKVEHYKTAMHLISQSYLKNVAVPSLNTNQPNNNEINNIRKIKLKLSPDMQNYDSLFKDLKQKLLKTNGETLLNNNDQTAPFIKYCKKMHSANQILEVSMQEQNGNIIETYFKHPVSKNNIQFIYNQIPEIKSIEYFKSGNDTPNE